MKDIIVPALRDINPAMGLAYQAEEKWLNTEAGEQLFFRVWKGLPGQPVVIYFHGIEGHSQWFAQTASHLQHLGMTIYAPDRRGAGRNSRNRGHLSSWTELMEDMNNLLALVRVNHPQEPLFLMGNCWGAQGSLILAHGCQAVGTSVSGVILTCPALAVKCDLTWPKKILVGLSWVIRSLATFEIPLTAEMLTDNPAYLEYLRCDPLRLTRATASFFVETLKLRKLAFEAGLKLQLPLLVLQSEADRIVDVPKIQTWFEAIPAADKTWKMFPNMAHSLDFDSNAQDYVTVLSKWITARCEVKPI